MKEKFKVVIGSPITYEELVAYIYINDEEVAIVQKENGVNKMMVELFEEKIKTEILLDDFIEALNEAKKELLK